MAVKRLRNSLEGGSSQMRSQYMHLTKVAARDLYPCISGTVCLCTFAVWQPAFLTERSILHRRRILRAVEGSVKHIKIINRKKAIKKIIEIVIICPRVV